MLDGRSNYLTSVFARREFDDRRSNPDRSTAVPLDGMRRFCYPPRTGGATMARHGWFHDEPTPQKDRGPCGNALRKLRRATNRGRMSERAALEIGAHMGICATMKKDENAPGICRYAYAAFMRRFGHLITGVPARKVRPQKKMVAAAAPVPTPVVPTEATNGTAPAETVSKPKRVRKPAAPGTPRTPRARRSKPAVASE